MHPRQYAFKQGYSTEAALHFVVHKLEKAVFNKQLALSLDIDDDNEFQIGLYDASASSISRRTP